MKIFNRIKLAFTYGPEIDSVLDDIRRKKALEEAKAKMHNLKLCFKHQQEQNGSHYSENNCDHCKLLRKSEYFEALGHVADSDRVLIKKDVVSEIIGFLDDFAFMTNGNTLDTPARNMIKQLNIILGNVK